jgi:hypothetical protein
MDISCNNIIYDNVQETDDSCVKGLDEFDKMQNVGEVVNNENEEEILLGTKFDDNFLKIVDFKTNSEKVFPFLSIINIDVKQKEKESDNYGR